MATIVAVQAGTGATRHARDRAVAGASTPTTKPGSGDTAAGEVCGRGDGDVHVAMLEATGSGYLLCPAVYPAPPQRPNITAAIVNNDGRWDAANHRHNPATGTIQR